MKKKIIQISEPDTGEEEWQAIKEPIFSGWLTQGSKVAEFERLFSNVHKVNRALAVTSCTAGLHLALEAIGIRPGDEVIVPAFTWISTANVVEYCGAKPVFVDVSRDSYNIDPKNIRAKVTKKTKAIIPVHLFGLSADIDAIRADIPENVKIVEDAACASGTIYKEKWAGSLGDIAAFSFHPRKSITTGEGGMVTTNDTFLAEKVSQMRNHGASISEEMRHKSPRPFDLPDFKLLGFNYRMTDLQGAVGIVQLKKLTEFINERAKWAEWYREQLKNIDWIKLPQEPKSGRHAWQSFVLYIDPNKAPISRNKMMEILQKNGVSTRPGTHAVHMLDFYKNKYKINPNDFPSARDCDQNTMAIPLHNRMTEDNYHQIVEEIKKFTYK